MAEKEDDDEEFDEIDFSQVINKVKGLFKKKPKKTAKAKKVNKAKKEVEEEDDEAESIDYTSVINYFKENKKLIFYITLISIISVGSWVRTLSMPNYNGKMPDLDSYVFLRYAQDIVKHGYLPEIDELRYFPEGFLTFREQQTTSYFIALIYYVMNAFNPGVEVIDASIIYPIVAFAIGMIFFYLMTKELTDKTTAIIATLFLAFAPSYLFRTMAGISDKEALAMVFWYSMTWAIIKSIKASRMKQVLLWGLLGGVLSGLNALTWGGANFLYHSIALMFIIMTFLGRLTKEHKVTFFTWAVPTIIMNATMTLRYGGFRLYENQIFLSTFIALGVIIIRYFYDSLIKSKKPKEWPEAVHFGLIVIAVIIPALIIAEFTGFFSITQKINEAVETILNPFGTCPFCVSVSENQAPYFFDPIRRVDWWHRLQWFIPLFVIGSALYYQKTMEKFRYRAALQIISFTAFILLFMFSKFSTEAKYESLNLFLGTIYIYSLPIFMLILALDYVTRHKSKAWNTINPINIFLIAWFSLSIIATRGAIRVVFALTPVAIIMAAYCITRGKEIIQKLLKDKVYSYSMYLIVLLVGVWAFNAVISEAGNYYPSYTDDWNKSMTWVKDNTPINAVFTHWWDYGYWVQTGSERATTVDGGNYDVKLNEVIGGYLFSGYNSTEILESLNYFGKNTTDGLKRPEYFLIIDDDILKYIQMANIGGRPGYYSVYAFNNRVNNQIFMPETYPTLLVFNPVTGYGKVGSDLVLGNNALYDDENTYIINIVVPFGDKQEVGPVLAVLYNDVLKTQTIMPYNCECETNVGCSEITNEGIPSCFNYIQQGIINIPTNLRERLMTRLYILNLTTPGFKIVYDDNASPISVQTIVSQMDPTDIKIYEINYTELEEASRIELSRNA